MVEVMKDGGRREGVVIGRGEKTRKSAARTD